MIIFKHMQTLPNIKTGRPDPERPDLYSMQTVILEKKTIQKQYVAAKQHKETKEEPVVNYVLHNNARDKPACK